METKETKETIDEIIARTFPEELIDLDQFEEWCEDNIRELIQPIAVNVIKELADSLKIEKKHLLDKEKIHRDYWDLFGHEKPVKSVRSIRTKLARDINDEEENDAKIESRLTVKQIERRIYQLSDLGRVRIVCTFYSDVEYISSVLLKRNLFLGKYECPKGIKDFIFDPKKRDGLKGHRAHQFSARIPLESNIAFGLEIQLMTLLQNAWDRRNHPIYERIREKKPLSSKLIVNDFSCSETLHLVDQQADRNWIKFLEEIKNGK